MTAKRQRQPSVKPKVAVCVLVIPSPAPSSKSSQCALRHDMLIPCRVAFVEAGTVLH